MEIITDIFGKAIYSQEDGLILNKKYISLNGRKNYCSGLIFGELTQKQITKAQYILNNLEFLDKKAHELFLKFYEEEDDIIFSFVNEHFNEYGDEIKEKIFKKLKISNQDNISFLNNLEFGSFYIAEGNDTNNVWITMDYNLIWQDSITFTDQILAIKFDENLEYISHSHDS